MTAVCACFGASGSKFVRASALMLQLRKAVAVETADTAMSTGRGHRRTDHHGQEEEWVYSSTLSSTSALDGVVVSVTPRPIYAPEKTPSILCTGGWVGPRDGVDEC